MKSKEFEAVCVEKSMEFVELGFKVVCLITKLMVTQRSSTPLLF